VTSGASSVRTAGSPLTLAPPSCGAPCPSSPLPPCGQPVPGELVEGLVDHRQNLPADRLRDARRVPSPFSAARGQETWRSLRDSRARNPEVAWPQPVGRTWPSITQSPGSGVNLGWIAGSPYSGRGYARAWMPFQVQSPMLGPGFGGCVMTTYTRRCAGAVFTRLDQPRGQAHSGSPRS